jgi:hypothetical protein
MTPRMQARQDYFTSLGAKGVAAPGSSAQAEFFTGKMPTS